MEKITWELNNDLDTTGTSLQGYLKTSYSNIIEKLGKPRVNKDEDKTRVEWNLDAKKYYDTENFNLDDIHYDRIIITIYDWKEDRPLEEVPVWNIGGKSGEALDVVASIFGWDDVHYAKGFIPLDFWD